MDWKEFIVEMTDHLAWPLVVLVLAVTFRDVLRQLISKVTGWKGFGQELSFSDKIAAAEVGADRAIEGRLSPQAPSGYQAEIFEGLGLRAEENPSYVILRCWERVEASLRRGLGDRAFTSQGLRRPLSWSQLQRQTMETDLPNDLLDSVYALKELRDEVAHGRAKPSPGEALAYLEMAKEVTLAVLSEAPISRPEDGAE